MEMSSFTISGSSFAAEEERAQATEQTKEGFFSLQGKPSSTNSTTLKATSVSSIPAIDISDQRFKEERIVEFTRRLGTDYANLKFAFLKKILI